MDERFLKAFFFTLNNEGGYVNDKDDPGGATNHGISLEFLKDVYNRGFKDADVNLDGVINQKDIEAMSYILVQRLYRVEFWDKVSMIPDDSLAIKVFDAGINIGIRKAIKLLQECVGVTRDGVIGPITLNAIKSKDQNVLLHNFINRLELYYYEIVYRNPTMNKFLKGWLNRAKRTPNNLELQKMKVS